MDNDSQLEPFAKCSVGVKDNRISETSKASALDMAVDTIEKDLAVLGSEINNLFDKLNPVLPGTPEEATPDSDEDSYGSSPLLRKLFSYHRTLELHKRVIRNLARDLEL